MWLMSCTSTPLLVVGPLDGEKSLSDVKNMIHKLYTSLNVDRHQVMTLTLILLTFTYSSSLPPSLPPSLQLLKEHELRAQLESLATELAPLEQQRQQLALRSERRTNRGQSTLISSTPPPPRKPVVPPPPLCCHWSIL